MPSALSLSTALTRTIVFHALTAANIRQIVDLMLGSVRKQLEQHDLVLEVADPVMEKLAADGFDPTYGARPLRRSVQRMIEDPLAEEVLLGPLQRGRYRPGRAGR